MPCVNKLSCAALAITLISSGLGQTRFEVASIKPSSGEDRRPFFNFQDGGRFTAANVTVRRLIQVAYRIKDFQISGGPGWAGSELYGINAKPEAPATNEQLMPMIQNLLADRFQLVLKRETKDMPVYALVVAKNGPKLKGADESAPKVIRIRRGLLTAPQGEMSLLAAQLSNFLGRAVIDKTGLTARYDLKLEWVPDENQVAMFAGMGVPEGAGAPPRDWQGPSLFTALEEQLGLRLESQKGPVEMFAIERIEKPTAN